MYYPALEEVLKRKSEGNLIPVCREIVADLETPVSAYLKLNRSGPSFLLESVEGGQHLARYSFLGTSPLKTLTIREEENIDPVSLVEQEMSRYRVVPVAGLPHFYGGAVGYLGYEVSSYLENIPSPDSDPLGLPLAVFIFTDTLLIFDHVTHKIKVLSLVRLDGDVEKSYREAICKIDNLVKQINQPLVIPLSDTPAPDSRSTFSSNFTGEEFAERVRQIKQYVADGEAIQVVLSQRLSRPTTVAPFEVYRALRSINPSPYMYYLDFEDFQIIGTSPEILVRVENGSVMTRPLAGTRPRGKTPDEDAKLALELCNDEKERAEHIMLVDLGRNDIGRVSEPGSVKVSELMDIERYSHVMHMVTHVQGRLRKNFTVFDALRACFPAGTVSGAPKVRAMEIIAQLEREKRGPYAGACGYFSYSGNMDMAIAIRTIIMSGGIACAQSGCGVVFDSIPELEFEETLNKAAALIGAIDQAEKSYRSFSSGEKDVITD